jgi:hypothetical protein
MVELADMIDRVSIEDKPAFDQEPLNQYEIISSKAQTKAWRIKCSWYKNGKSNECEKYQLEQIKSLIGIKPAKCQDRFYIATNEIKKKANPMKDIDGFEYTEDFDGKLERNGKTYYFNLKFCCDAGGAQTRTMRLVYDFIRCQVLYITRELAKPVSESKLLYFINILDGDTSNHHMKQIQNLIEKYKTEQVATETDELNETDDIYTILKKYIFIGDMLEFSNKNSLLDILQTTV